MQGFLAGACEDACFFFIYLFFIIIILFLIALLFLMTILHDRIPE